MIRLEEKYEQAVQFRKRGFTYSEIAKIVDVSKSTVSVWLSKKAFSKKVKDDNLKRAAKDNVKRIGLINKARSAERKRTYADALKNAETEYRHYKKDPLFVAGLATYLACGDTNESARIRVSSQSVSVHGVVVRFLVEYLGVSKEKIHFWLLLPGQKLEKKNLIFWSKRINLPVSQFYGTQYNQSSADPERLKSGAGNTLCSSTVLKMKLLCWVKLLEEDVYKTNK